MVGDSVNDTSALTVAYVGAAIGSETDVAIEAAEVTLIRDDPLDVVKAIRISDPMLQKTRQNLVWALGYNTATISLSLIGFLQPEIVAATMGFSSVSGQTNAYCSVRVLPTAIIKY